VAFFNHDSALFIGVWMVAKALADAWAERRRPDCKMLGGGVLGSLGGILLIEYLRTSLLKGETGWELRGMTPPTNPLTFEGYSYFHFVVLPGNLDVIYYWIMHPRSDFLFVITLPLVSALALAVILVVRNGVKAAPLAVYAMTMVSALLLFGFVEEQRHLLELVPFVCLGGILAAKPHLEI
jgi:hypothetical protein